MSETPNPFATVKTKSLSEATFEELVQEASRKAKNDATVNLLKSCPELHEKLLKDLELESFVQGQLIKHLEHKLRAASKIK
jgi:hypothetical protein